MIDRNQQFTFNRNLWEFDGTTNRNISSKSKLFTSTQSHGEIRKKKSYLQFTSTSNTDTCCRILTRTKNLCAFGTAVAKIFRKRNNFQVSLGHLTNEERISALCLHVAQNAEEPPYEEPPNAEEPP